jgi:hypothetical protein
MGSFDFEKIMGNELFNKLTDVIIYQKSKNSVCLFEQYTITRNDSNQYIVNKHFVLDMLSFSSLKHAVCWCIYDKRNKIVDCSRIHELDRRYCSVNIAIDIHRLQSDKYTKSKSYDLLDISNNKLQEDHLLLSQINNELSRYIDESKRWQLKRFTTIGDK